MNPIRKLWIKLIAMWEVLKIPAEMMVSEETNFLPEKDSEPKNHPEQEESGDRYLCWLVGISKTNPPSGVMIGNPSIVSADSVGDAGEMHIKNILTPEIMKRCMSEDFMPVVMARKLH